MESVRGVTATAGSNPALSASEAANFFSTVSASQKGPGLPAHLRSKPTPSGAISEQDFGPLNDLSISHACDNCMHESLLHRPSNLGLHKKVGRDSGQTSRGFMQVHQPRHQGRQRPQDLRQIG